MKISYFDNITSKPAHVEIEAVIAQIKGDRFKKQIEEIRAADEKTQERLKKELPGVTFGGTFKTRSMKGLLQASGLLCLDFDTPGYVCPDSLLPFMDASFRSPRGGLKIVVRIPVVTDDAEFKGIFRALEIDYPDTDPSGKDISRICFFSWDPELYLNEQAEVWQ